LLITAWASLLTDRLDLFVLAAPDAKGAERGGGEAGHNFAGSRFQEQVS